MASSASFTDEFRFCLQHHDSLIRVCVDTVGRSYCTVALCITTMVLKSIMVLGGKKSPIENVWSTLTQRLARNTPDTLWQYVEATWTDVPQGYIQSLFDCKPWCVAAVITNNVSYTNY
ncbi:hypothetical protein TNCV_463371 [Trichonephila clavipes]|nr:hypothetical protein TNCV_463371 [Trichonephila clavipes]